MTPRGIAAIASAEPARRALVDGDRTVTYAELNAGINRVAHALAGGGVTPGDRVAVRLQNRVELFVAWNACARVGALVVPVSTRLTAPEVAYILGNSGAVVLVGDRESAIDAAAVRHIDVDDAGLRELPETPPLPEFSGSPVLSMAYTSGTTGRPKGIMRMAPPPMREPPPNPVAAFWGFGADDVHLLCGPGYHTAPGAYAQMHLVEGATVVIMRSFDATSCLQLIEQRGVTTSHMVPANFIRILETDWQRFDMRSVRRVLHAAAPCPVAVKRRILEVFPAGSVWEYYGASEGMGSVISPQEWEQRPGSVGRAFPGVALHILDDAGNEAPAGEVGTVYIEPPAGHGFQYHDDEAATRAAWRGAMFTAGDLGWLDADGYLFIADRRVDLIICGGVNVYPAEVERELAELEEVVDSAVFGLPDERMGQRVHAVVQLRAGARRDAEALVARLRERLAAFKLPRTMSFVDELPREPNGKVLKQALRDAELAQQVGRT